MKKKKKTIINLGKFDTMIRMNFHKPKPNSNRLRGLHGFFYNQRNRCNPLQKPLHFFYSLMAINIVAIPALIVILSTAQAAPIDNVQDREMERAASRLYDGAMKYYKTEAYWKAARELITILDFYPAFSEIDGVLMHLGESLYNMRMYDSASRMFRYLATKYPNSPYLAKALHGLQRVNYQSGDLIESLKIYNGFASRFASEEIIDGAHYFGGMAYFQMQNFDSTVAALTKISMRSKYYDYGLYTTGLALLKKKV
jgi:outer membrane protein assembly factor BamD (BamD/ComL family)